MKKRIWLWGLLALLALVPIVVAACGPSDADVASDNVTYTVQQIDPIDVSTTHYRVIFKPEAIIPDFDRP